jgi:thiol-disulfide isomerase/thioredoxin
MALLSLVVFALTAAAAGRSAGGEPDDPPPVFDKRPYAEAKKAAEEAKKWFIVKATAAWCLPCRQMDKSTWRDEKVVDWIRKNAIASEFDVDKDQDVAKQLGIKAMPTMIAFKDGKEFDRVVGLKPRDEFLTWLEGLARGETSIEAERKAAGDRGAQNGKVVVPTRLNHADSLARSGKAAEAADEYAWLWKNMLDYNPAYHGVRCSFMASDMEKLAGRDEGAKRTFTKLRNETAKAIEGEKVDKDDVVDWVILNRIIGDPKATLTWYDRVKGQARWRSIVLRVVRELAPLLIAEQRWADIDRLSENLVEELKQRRETVPDEASLAGLSEEHRNEIKDLPNEIFRSGAQVLYAELLAAGRDEHASRLAAKAREHDPSPAMIRALVWAALGANQPRREHLDWIKVTCSEDERLRGAVKAALDKAK